MAKIFSIGFSLAAILLVAHAYPRPNEGGDEAAKPEVPDSENEPSEGAEGSETTKSPCAAFEEQCKGQEQMSAQCQTMQQQCGTSTPAPPVSPPAGMSPPTQPPMNQPTQPTPPPTEMPNQNSTMPNFGGYGRK